MLRNVQPAAQWIQDQTNDDFYFNWIYLDLKHVQMDNNTIENCLTIV